LIAAGKFARRRFQRRGFNSQGAELRVVRRKLRLRIDQRAARESSSEESERLKPMLSSSTTP
jgi:hypothetical protein